MTEPIPFVGHVEIDLTRERVSNWALDSGFSIHEVRNHVQRLEKFARIIERNMRKNHGN